MTDGYSDEQDFIEDEAAEARAFIAGDRESVWRHWVDVDLLAQWWWPMFDDTRYEVDAQPGGVYRIHSVQGGMAVSGEYAAVEAPRRLEFSWHWSGEDSESTVEVTFGEGDGGTIVTVEHSGIRFEDLDPLTEGWEDILTRLEELFDEMGA